MSKLYVKVLKNNKEIASGFSDLLAIKRLLFRYNNCPGIELVVSEDGPVQQVVGRKKKLRTSAKGNYQNGGRKKGYKAKERWPG